mmetsp:Transcript_15136/g.26380  ORF Transcript_15136/g.26380 Transcript_15136/m.26380 type:complete len:266 (+) Transcript_15136:2059-2856(+)
MQRDEIGHLQRFVQWQDIDANRLARLLGDEWIISDNLHAESLSALGNFSTNPSKPDDGECLIDETDAYVFGSGPLSLLHTSVGVGNMSSERAHECDGMFCRGNAIARWGIHDHDSALRCGGQINIIDSNSCTSYDFKLGSCEEDFPCDFDARSYDERVVLGYFAQQRGLVQSEVDRDMVVLLQDGETFLGELLRYKDVVPRDNVRIGWWRSDAGSYGNHLGMRAFPLGVRGSVHGFGWCAHYRFSKPCRICCEECTLRGLVDLWC